MMPSRGAQLGVRALRLSQRPAFQSSRNFSAVASRPLILSIAQQQTAFSPSRQQHRKFSWNPVDWAKSIPKPADAQVVPPTPIQTPATAVTPDAVALSAAEIPTGPSSYVSLPSPDSLLLTQEHIGYLHSLGLDYGWGPTSMVQWLLEHIHVYSGMPWWGSLITTAVAIRLALVPLTIKMSDSQARMAHIKPVLDPLNKRLSETLRSKDTLAMAETRKEINDIRRRSGFSLKWMGAAMTANMVFAYCSFKLLRAMAALPVPGFHDGGALWFKDLTLADPFYIIPGLMAAGFHFSIRYGAETGGVDPYAAQPGMKTLMMYVLPGVIWVSMAWFSAALTIWMAAGGAVSILVGRMMLNPSFREKLGITAMPSKAAAQPMPTLANLLAEETAEAATTQPGRVIDVKASRVQPGQMTYQAPRLNKSKFSTSATSSYRDASAVKAPTAKETLFAAAAPASKAAPKGALEKYTDWASARVNDLGETYALLGRKASGAFKKAKSMQSSGDDDVPESKSKSKEYLRQAREYERRYEQEKKRGWRQ